MFFNFFHNFITGITWTPKVSGVFQKLCNFEFYETK